MAELLVSLKKHVIACASYNINLLEGITLPSTEAQIRNMRGIYERAGLDPARTAYVECHGTGTQAGDVRELKAVSQSICRGRAEGNPIYVGSIKTNIGHLEGAAGIAGVIKGILTVEQGMIPKHINFTTSNPAIDFDGWKVKVGLIQLTIVTLLILK